MSRHGKIAEGKVQMGFVAPIELRDRLKRLADADARTLSNYLVLRLTEVVEREEATQRRTKRLEPKTG